jgi:hypothetical protein
MTTSAPPKSWRDLLPIHPAADLFPLTSRDELRALAEDIKKNGLRESVALYDDPELGRCLLDGRNRLDAMELLGKEVIHTGAAFPNIGLWKPVGTREPFDPYAYVVSVNYHRRHLTAEQKRDLIAKVLEATPERSNRQIAETVKASHVTVGAVRAKMERRGQIDHVETHTDTKGRKQQAHWRTSAKRKISARKTATATTGPVGNAVDPARSNEQREAEARAAEVALDRGDDPQTVWRRRLLYRAQEAQANAAFDDWSEFEIDQQLLEAARRAADSWRDVAAYLEKLLQDRDATIP